MGSYSYGGASKDSLEVKAVRMAERAEMMKPEIAKYEMAVKSYEANAQAQTRAMNQLRTLSEQYKALDEKYQDMTKYTSQSGENASKRNTIQQQMRETANTLEKLNPEVQRTLDRATRQGRELMRISIEKKFSIYPARVAHELKSLVGKQILYLQNGQTMKFSHSEAFFRAVQLTEEMPKVKAIDSTTERKVDVKVGSETRSMNLKPNETLVIRTVNDGLSRVQVQGFTSQGQVIVKDLFPNAAIRGMSSGQNYILDFTKLTEVTAYHSSQKASLNADSKETPKQKLRIQASNMQRFEVARLNQWERFRSPQQGNGPVTSAPRPGSVGTPPAGLPVGR